jgi:hypothetical protein
MYFDFAEKRMKIDFQSALENSKLKKIKSNPVKLSVKDLSFL